MHFESQSDNAVKMIICSSNIQHLIFTFGRSIPSDHLVQYNKFISHCIVNFSAFRRKEKEQPTRQSNSGFV
jgi:hypothetical protein